MTRTLSKKYQIELERLADKQRLKLATKKSDNAREKRKYPLTEIEITEFLNAIDTYNWDEKPGISNFAESLKQSVCWVNRRLGLMVKMGKIERFRGRSVTGICYCYRLVESKK
jgi:hypothetical protein